MSNHDKYLEVHEIQKMVAQLQVALAVAAFGQAVESRAHVQRVTIPKRESYWAPDGADAVDEQRYQSM
jgi:hypothetical protein